MDRPERDQTGWPGFYGAIEQISGEGKIEENRRREGAGRSQRGSKIRISYLFHLYNNRHGSAQAKNEFIAGNE